MKIIIRKFSKINFIVLLFTLSICNVSTAQKRPLQNVQRVTVTSFYVLHNGDKTDESKMFYQELYDSLGRLHTEINWNFPDNRPHSYIWHTFNGKQKVKTENFANQLLQMVREYSYSKDSLISQEIIKRIKPADTSIYLILHYKYSPLNKPIQIDAKTATGEIAYTSKSVFDNKGIELSRKVKTKSGYCPLDSIMKMTCKPLYDSLGRLSSNLTSIAMFNKSTSIRNFKYIYDRKNNIIGITVFDSKGNQISRELRMFQESRNRLSMIKYFDSKDFLTLWLVKRYEIYRYKNRLKFEIDY